jgi:hypothetical protein
MNYDTKQYIIFIFFVFISFVILVMRLENLRFDCFCRFGLVRVRGVVMVYVGFVGNIYGNIGV